MKRGDEEKHLKAQCDVQNSLKINLLEKKKKEKKMTFWTMKFELRLIGVAAALLRPRAHFDSQRAVLNIKIYFGL